MFHHLRVWIASALAVGAWGGGLPSEAADLEVEIVDLKDQGGSVRTFVWRGAESFNALDKALYKSRFQSRPGRATLAFTGLEPGEYAVLVIHDEDDDGYLDLFLGMIPVEGWGLSNNPDVTGPPDFSEAAIPIDGPGAKITIRMRY